VSASASKSKLNGNGNGKANGEREEFGAGSGASGGEREAAQARKIFEASIKALSACGEDALSRAVCPGIVDPNQAVDWVERADRVLRFQSERSALRSEVPVVAERLEALVSEVELPPHLSPSDVALSFVKRLPSIRALLAQDVEAAYEGDPAASSLQEIVLAYPAIRALSIHRIAHELEDLGVPLVPRIISEYAHDRTGIDIHPGARIGRHFFIDHGTGVVIGETCILGNRVKLYHGVTLGAYSNRAGRADVGTKRHPTLENDVTIYPNATILGGDTVIGEGSIVGGNVWLTQSVPSFTRVNAEPPSLQLHQKPPPGIGEGI